MSASWAPAATYYTLLHTLPHTHSHPRDTCTASPFDALKYFCQRYVDIVQSDWGCLLGRSSFLAKRRLHAMQTGCRNAVLHIGVDCGGVVRCGVVRCWWLFLRWPLGLFAVARRSRLLGVDVAASRSWSDWNGNKMICWISIHNFIFIFNLQNIWKKIYSNICRRDIQKCFEPML